MTGVSAVGFSGYLGDLRLVTGRFMGFWGWMSECGAPQGDSWVFEGYGSLLRGLIKGFLVVYTVLVILVILVNFTLKL